MPTLHRDFESCSTLDLTNVGAYRYATDPSTDVHCFAYTVDDGEVQLWKPGDPTPPEVIEAATNPAYIVAAHNDAFERLIETHIMGPRYGWPIIPIERHRCTMARGLSLALPMSLDGAAKALGLQQRKDKSGARLMKALADRAYSPMLDELKILYEYCRQDVRVERELHQRIGDLPETEQQLWLLDQLINDRGVPIDVPSLDQAIEKGSQALTEITAELANITNGAIDSVGQANRFVTWLRLWEFKVPDARKATLQKVLAGNDLPAHVRRAIELRIEGAGMPVSRLQTMRAWVDGDNRIRHGLKFHLAATGRWGSLGVQLHSLPKNGDGRYAIAAAAGSRFIDADFSGIESRTLAWLADETSKLEDWRRFDATGVAEDDPYLKLGQRCGVVADARSIGKTADLAFGYGGSIGAWRRLAPDDQSTDDQVRAYRDAWQAAHPKTKTLWHTLNQAAVLAVKMPGKRYEVNAKLSFECDGTFLKLRLPSGRKVSYPYPRLELNDREVYVVVFKDNAGKKFDDYRKGAGAWHGTWIENAVQAVARDLLVTAMQRLEYAGYPIVLHVHDEIVVEAANGFGSIEDFRKHMLEPPIWAEGLPLNCKVRNGPRFGKEVSGEQEPKPPPQAEPEAKSNGHDQYNGHHHGHGDDAGDDRDRHDHADRDGYPAGEPKTGFRRLVAEFVYREAHGAPYLKVLKWEPRAYSQQYWTGRGWAKGEPKPRIPYRLPELLAAPLDEPAWITEGEKDAEGLAALGLVATTNSGGAGKFWPELIEYFKGRQHVYLTEDNDAPGRKHVRKIADMLRGIVPDVRIICFSELKEHGDVSDFFALGGTKAMLLDRAENAPQANILELEAVRASDVTMQGFEWIWLNRFAKGKIGLIAGLPDEGKGQIFAAIIAAITTGGPWPCGEGRAPLGNVILLSCEDGVGDTIVPRLKAAGADLDRVHIIKLVKDGDKKQRMLSLVTDLEMLRRKIERVGEVIAVLIDPVSAYLGAGKIDTYRTSDVRAVLAPMGVMAEELNIAIIGILHFNKKLDVNNVLLRVSDSLAFGAAARHLFGVIDDPDNKRKLVVRGKNNLAPRTDLALTYTFATKPVGQDPKTGADIEAPYIVWGKEYVNITATEALQAANESRSPAALDEAMEMLRVALSAGPMLQSEIEDLAKSEGVSKATLRRAKKRLNIDAKKDGPANERGERTWRWRLPGEAA